MRSWLSKAATVLFVMFAGVCFLGIFVGTWFVQVPFILATGWAFFLKRVLPQVSWDWSAIAQTVVVVAVLGAGGHAFARRAWRQAHPDDPRSWPVRWTASLLGLVVLLFCATMSTVGIGHHVGWLSTSQESLLDSNWPIDQMQARRQVEGLCKEAVEVLKRDPSGASLSRALLESGDVGNDAEKRHTVLVSGAEGARVLVVFPRDPRQRETEGAVRCELTGGRVHYPASELPRLLAGEAVAGGTPDSSASFD
ncbi:hypothetical protein ACLESO_17315 [Pyxidicoccus sp. 3LG]